MKTKEATIKWAGRARRDNFKGTGRRYVAYGFKNKKFHFYFKYNRKLL